MDLLSKNANIPVLERSDALTVSARAVSGSWAFVVSAQGSDGERARMGRFVLGPTSNLVVVGYAHYPGAISYTVEPELIPPGAGAGEFFCSVGRAGGQVGLIPSPYAIVGP